MKTAVVSADVYPWFSELQGMTASLKDVVQHFAKLRESGMVLHY